MKRSWAKSVSKRCRRATAREDQHRRAGVLRDLENEAADWSRGDSTASLPYKTRSLQPIDVITYLKCRAACQKAPSLWRAYFRGYLPVLGRHANRCGLFRVANFARKLPSSAFLSL